MRPQVEERGWPGVSLPRPLPRILQGQFHATAKVLVIRQELLEFLIAPKGLEGTAETFDNVRCFNLAQLDGPFNTVFKSRSRQVSGADVYTAESVIPLKQPGLSV